MMKSMMLGLVVLLRAATSFAGASCYETDSYGANPMFHVFECVDGKTFICKGSRELPEEIAKAIRTYWSVVNMGEAGTISPASSEALDASCNDLAKSAGHRHLKEAKILN